MIPLTLVCLALVAALVVQTVVHAKERQTLLDRIQSPEKVISERISTDAPMLRAVHPDSDEDYWKAREELK